jgi:hypothetical protein
VVVEDRTYEVTPSTAMVWAGIVTGAMTEMKLKLKNTSAGDSVRMIAGKIFYLDGQGQRVKLEDSRTEPVLKLDGFGAERLDPGQEATQAVAVNFAVTIAERK